MPVIALTTISIGEYAFNPMEDRGLEREEWFRLFWELPKRIPDTDTFHRLFERIRPEELLRWLSGEEGSGGREVNRKGKMLRGSRKRGSHEGLHGVSCGWGKSKEKVLKLRQFPTDWT
jgi:hypothetical protein